jgi:hypothetical protein
MCEKSANKDKIPGINQRLWAGLGPFEEAWCCRWSLILQPELPMDLP